MELNRLHNQTNESLISAIESLRQQGLSVFGEICEHLNELWKRGKKDHPLFKDRLYKHFAAVASGRLLPACVLAFSGNPGKLACVEGRPADVQKRIASGLPVPVLWLCKGEIAETSRSPAIMSLAELVLAFPPGKPPRTLAEQRAILQAQIDAVPPGAKTHVRGQPILRAVPSENPAVKIGNEVAVPLTALSGVLAELGFRIVPLENHHV